MGISSRQLANMVERVIDESLRIVMDLFDRWALLWTGHFFLQTLVIFVSRGGDGDKGLAMFFVFGSPR